MRPILLAAVLSAFLMSMNAAGVVYAAPTAPSPPLPSSPSTQCRQAIAVAEGEQAIPSRLLAAIGRIESGRKDPVGGTLSPWPWTLNAEGQGRFFDTKAEAVEAVRALRARGVRSIDVGCMQVNLMHHPVAFANLEQAFDPGANAAYAARFLTQLYTQTKDWPQAVAHYHSATPELGNEYRRKVLAAWPEEQRQPATSPLASAWSATLQRGAVTRVLPAAGGVVLPAADGAIASPANSATTAGRDLASYRALPVFWAVALASGKAPPTSLTRAPRAMGEGNVRAAPIGVTARTSSDARTRFEPLLKPRAPLPWASSLGATIMPRNQP